MGQFKIPQGRAATHPQGQTLVTSLKLLAASTLTLLRARAKLCWPMNMGTLNDAAPAGALKVWVCPPEVTVSVPAVLSSVTTKTASCMDR